MERRAILAAVLMAALLILYQSLFSSPPSPPPPAPPKEAAESAPPAAAPEPVPPAGSTAAAPGAQIPATAPDAMVPERPVAVETPLYTAQVSNRGATLTRWHLHYRGDKPMILPGQVGPLGTSVERSGVPPRVVGYEVAERSVALGPERPQGEVKFEGEDGYGLRVSETLRFRADGYTIERHVQVENRHQVPQTAEIAWSLQAPERWPATELEAFQGQHPTRVVALTTDGVHREDLASAKVQSLKGRWIGLESEWYLSALVPRGSGFVMFESRLAGEEAGSQPPMVRVGLRAKMPVLQPGQRWEGRILQYTGPKEYERLKALGVELEQAVFFGGFPLPQRYGGLPMAWVAIPILWLMHQIYGLTGNYGIAIILLTIITKVLFFPLTVKSMRSMKAMQALQPQVAALKSKLRGDPQRLQRETMDLYRKHRVNPMGGCLPMVVQIPIFYALYVALSVSVEIQNAPFICFGRAFGVDLWICDLAAHDPTYVLPILMGVSMFVQQKMTPVMGDPRQAKIMLVMPVVFTFMFLNLPSGLVLYWTLSNILQIGQQYYMDRAGSSGRALAREAKKA